MIRNISFMPNMLSPAQVDSQTLSAGVASAATPVLPGSVLRIVNTHATQTMYINFGTLSSNSAMNTDIPILVQQELFIQVPNSMLFLCYLGSGAGTTFNLVKGI